MAIVLITGCGGGFGRHTALAFAARGDTVYAGTRSGGIADATDAAPHLHWLQLDVTDREEIARRVQEIIREQGRIDVLVNNAGINIAGAAEDLGDQDIDLVMRTNFFGPVWLSRAVLPAMRARNRGRIIMVSSLSALVGLPGDSLYCASKAALEGFAEGLRYEVDRFGIGVCVIEPGLFRTGMPAKIISTFRSGADSTYAPLSRHLQERARARLGAGDDPQRVADLIVEVAHCKTPAFRYPAGAQAQEVVGKIAKLNDTERETFIRDVQGTAWWSTGSAHHDLDHS